MFEKEDAKLAEEMQAWLPEEKIYSFGTSYFDYIFASKCEDKCG